VQRGKKTWKVRHLSLLGKEKNFLATSHPSVKVRYTKTSLRGKKRSPTASVCGDQTHWEITLA